MIAGLALGLVALVALQLVRGDSYWNYSEGVYALTSRALLDGADLYGGTAVAQPPALFLTGAALLGIEDSIGWLRLSLGVVQLAGALAAAAVVWRLTAHRVATAVTVPLAMLAPWAVHEHGQLQPELFAGPLLLLGVLLVDRADGRALGLVAALAPSFKLPYLLPAAVLVLLARDRRRAAIWAGAALAIEAVVATVVFGTGLWGNLVTAQAETGRIGLEAVVKLWSQAGWNLIGLVAAAVVAWALRREAREPRMLTANAAVAVALLATFATNVKRGTFLNVTLPVEALLVPLAVTGVVLALRARPRLAVLAAAGVAFAAAQGLWLLADGATDGAHLFKRPGSAAQLGPVYDKDEIDRRVAEARACDPRLAYPGFPYVAFVAERRVPGDQPDGFITRTAGYHEARERRMNADQPLCPPAVR